MGFSILSLGFDVSSGAASRSQSASCRKARPRWLTSAFSVAVNSAKVFPSGS